MSRLFVFLATLLVFAAVACADETGNAASRATVLWAIGDGGAEGEAPREVAALVARRRPYRILYLGDVYETGTPGEYRRNFAGVYGRLVRRMWPTSGNHEWPGRAQGYARFWQKVRGRPIPYHYSRKAGGWEVLSVNSEDPENGEQLAWLRRRASRGGNCRLMFMHRPRFNAGKHRDEEEDIAGLWDALDGGAALVVSGHDHNFQRFHPVDGAVQYVSGAGGKGHYDVDEGDPRLAFSDDEAFGALRIQLRPGVAKLAFVAADGTTLDRSTVTCRRG